MSMSDDTEAREEWFNSFGYYPTDEDFPWPYFRDAFYAGKKSTEKSEHPDILIANSFKELLKLEWIPQYEVVVSLLEKWITQSIVPDEDISELSDEYVRGWNEYHFKLLEKLK